MIDRFGLLPVVCGVVALATLTACSNATISTPAPGTATPGPPVVATAAADVLFTGCGTATIAEPTPQFVSASPGVIGAGTPQLVIVPVAEADALALVHETLSRSALDRVNVSCAAKAYPAAQVSTFVTGNPVMSSTVWVVAAALKPNGTPGTPNPEIGQPAAAGSGLPHYQLYFISNDHPVRIYGVIEYPAGLPLPTAFSALG